MKTKFITAFFILAIVLSGCKKDDDETILRVDQTTFSVDAKKSTVTFTVYSNVDWTLSYDENTWIALPVYSGIANNETPINIEISGNKETTARETKIKITAADKTIEITIHQNGKITGDDLAFDDENFKQALVSSYDKDDDGEISAEEAQAITNLSINNKGIKSLKCIENLTSLQILDCSNNDIDSLDLSKNTKLDSINCSDNRNLKYLKLGENVKRLACENVGIKSLDLSNSSIEKLYIKPIITYNDKTPISINVSKSNIKEIVYGYNLIYHYNDYTWPDVLISLNDNPNLETIYGICQYEIGDFHGAMENIPYGDQISINADNCPMLTSVKVNNIKDISIKNCTSLNDLYCDGSFQILDCTGSSNLKSIKAISNKLNEINVNDCTELEQLESEAAYVKSLNLSTATKLKTLDCSLKGFNTTLDLRQNKMLENINIKDAKYGVDDESIRALNASDLPLLKTLTSEFKFQEIDVSNCPTLEMLDCKGVATFKADNCPSLHKIFLTNGSLESLDISEYTTLDTLSVMSNTLSSIKLNKKIKYLDCSSNKLTTLEIDGLTDLTWLDCQYNTSLSSLNINNCISLKQIALNENNLNTFNLSNCNEFLGFYSSGGSTKIKNISIKNCNAFMDFHLTSSEINSLEIANCSSLKTVNCQNNNLQSLNITNCDAIEVIDCGNNKINSLSLEKFVNLKDLNCYQNQLTTLDISKNHKLETIDCCQNKNLTTLYLYKNHTISSLNKDDETNIVLKE